MKAASAVLLLAVASVTAVLGGAITGEASVATLFNHGLAGLAAGGNMATGWAQGVLSTLDTTHLGHSPLPGLEFRFVPEYRGQVFINGSTSSVQAPSRCFKSNTIQLLSVTDTTVSLSLVAAGKNFTLLCDDLWLFGTVSTGVVLKVTTEGSHNVTVPRTDGFPAGAGAWIQREGVYVFSFLDGEAKTVSAVAATAALFLPSEEEAGLDNRSANYNIEFIEEYTEFRTPQRSFWTAENSGLLDIPLDEFQSGDVMSIFRPDGLASLEIWGAGAGADHMAIVWRFADDPDTPWVVESTVKSPHWPTHNGVQKMPLKDWLWTHATAANYSVGWLRARPELRAKFNESSAEEWIADMLGQPYGFHNFLFSFIDTVSDNYPWPWTAQFLEVAASWIGIASPAAADKLFNLAFNKRLGTTGLNTAQSSNTAAQQGMTFAQLFAIPESDEWVYKDGRSYVCSAFACSVLKAAGAFGAVTDEINCTEFPPRDVYQLAFWTEDYPEACKADPTPWCIIVGRYQIDMPHFNSVEPYAHMSEHCGGLPPNYVRQPGC